MNRKTNIGYILIALSMLFYCCTDNQVMKFKYLQDGEIQIDEISLADIIQNGKVHTSYVDSVKFSILDSVAYPDGNPDHDVLYTTPVSLDFSKKIEPYSPEYYAIYVTHNTTKAIEYYNRLFENKIDFNSQEEYKSIGISFGDITFFTTPKNYILEKGSHPSPSIIFHEIGHRAFWYLEDSIGIKFKGLSYVHMGLLEYYSTSLNNSPLVGEDMLPIKTLRNASWTYSYPPADSLKLRGLMDLLKKSYPKKLEDPQSNISKYYAVAMETYKDYLDIFLDNHRGGMIITSTLWRIREQLGQEQTDKLVTQTILNLNSYMEQRSDFYQPLENEKLLDKIDWYDLFYGMIQKDQELFDGRNKQIIVREFETTNFPINKIRL